MNDTSPKTDQAPRLQATAQAASLATLDILEVLRRQFWLIASCGALGMLLAVIYWANAPEWYETRAKMLVTMKSPKISDPESGAWGQDAMQEDALANHMEIVRSRDVISRALEGANLTNLKSIQQHLDDETDAIDYVSAHLVLTKGGDGVARDARSLNIAFRHTDPEDGLKVLTAIVSEYEAVLGRQVESFTTSASSLIAKAKGELEKELKEIGEKYVDFRKNAPVLYGGEGTSNVYYEKVRRLQQEMWDIDIKRAAVATRLAKANEALATIERSDGTDLDRLALIDEDSMERLGVFAGLQTTAANSAEFMKDMPMRQQYAQWQITNLTELKAQRQTLESNFGRNHPSVQNLDKQIAFIEETLAKTAAQTTEGISFEKITPKMLIESYLGFLRTDLANLDEQKVELTLMAAEAEKEAKKLVAFELEEQTLRNERERRQLLYNSVVEQLRTLNTVSGMSGYVHEVLETPRLGERVWPNLRVCVMAGCFLGLMLGLMLGVMNDQVDKRFRTPAEIDAATGVPVIGQVGRIRRARGARRAARMIVDAQAPEAESFRLLRTYLLKDVKAGSLKLVSATSCQTQDGKSTILCNLAASFAELGLRTLIVDGDMRAPTTHRFFDIPVTDGLSDLLQGKLVLKDAVKQTGIEDLFLLTAGSAVRNPAELLQSEEFDNLLDDLKAEFDLIVIDSGPVLWVSDPAIVAQRCDATLMVVRSSTDTKRKVMESIRRLRSSNANIRGCIINTYGSSKEFTQDTGYSSPYHYYYYGGYGRRVRETPSNGNGNGKGENGHTPHSSKAKYIPSDRNGNSHA